MIPSAEEAEEFTQALAQVHAGGWRLTLHAVRQGIPDALGLSVPEWQQRLGGYVRLAVPERREAVAELTEQGLTTREIGEVLGVDHSTIVRDGANAPEKASETLSDKGEEATSGANAPEPEATALLEPTETESESELPPTEPQPQPVPIEPLAPGWHQLGEHRLYCGDSTDPEFVEACGGAAFAFADPPYNAGKADWDQGFIWGHDYLADVAGIVAVTPGIASLAGFLGKTSMPYQWSMAAEISNGMTRGALGFGNWVCVTVFARGSIYRQSKDHYRVPAHTLDDQGGTHPSRKPFRLLTHLIGLFTAKGDTVIDPFLGSGTTLLAAEQEGRRCVGAEVDPMHCADIVARYRAAMR